MISVAAIEAKLINIIAPGNSAEFMRLLQEADDRLLEFGKWNWTRRKLILTPVDNMISLPAEFVSIYAARVGTLAKDVHAEEFEFIADGVGEVPINGMGDGRLIDQGFETAIFESVMETRRVYKIYGEIPTDWTVTVLARYAPANLTSDSSSNGSTIYTRCPDLAALKLMMLAIVYEENNDVAISSQYVATALRGLDNKEKAHRAGAKQTLKVSPFGNGVSSIRNLR